MIQDKIIVQNENGLHARPASELVKVATGFNATIKIVANDKHADAKSIISILSLGLTKDDEVMMTVEGQDEIEAMQEMKALFASCFGEA